MWLFRRTQDPVGLDEPFLKGGVTKEDMFPRMIVIVVWVSLQSEQLTVNILLDNKICGALLS